VKCRCVECKNTSELYAPDQSLRLRALETVQTSLSSAMQGEMHQQQLMSPQYRNINKQLTPFQQPPQAVQNTPTGPTITNKAFAVPVSATTNTTATPSVVQQESHLQQFTPYAKHPNRLPGSSSSSSSVVKDQKVAIPTIGNKTNLTRVGGVGEEVSNWTYSDSSSSSFSRSMTNLSTSSSATTNTTSSTNHLMQSMEISAPVDEKKTAVNEMDAGYTRFSGPEMDQFFQPTTPTKPVTRPSHSRTVPGTGSSTLSLDTASILNNLALNSASTAGCSSPERPSYFPKDVQSPKLLELAEICEER